MIGDGMDICTAPSYAAPPFACPPEIVLTLPVPPAVNQTRRINWAKHAKHMAWRDRAHSSVLLVPKARRIPIKGAYRIDIVVDESIKTDLDATLKSLIDYCVTAGLTQGDEPKYLRGFSAKWGAVENRAVRVTLRPVEEPKS
jgi:hypothetical protein